MKTSSTQREILLATNNSFAERKWCNKELNHNESLTPQEQMEEVCASGLIYDLMPELFKAPENKKLYLWNMRTAFCFLQLHYGEFPLAIEDSTSLNPHNFLACANYN